MQSQGFIRRTVRKWIARYQAEGPDGLADRNSRPHRQPRATPVRIIARITALRFQRQPGTVGESPATVSRVWQTLSLNKRATHLHAGRVLIHHTHAGDIVHGCANAVIEI